VSKRTKVLLAIGAVAALVIGWQVAAFASHPEASLAGSNFEIDTNANLTTDDDQPPSVDWGPGEGGDGLAHTGTNPPEIRAIDKATGQTDDSYKGGVKEVTECPGEVTGSIPNNKSDLLTFHVNEEEGTSAGDPGYLNLAWSRVSDPSGTTLMDFEFNQHDTVNDPNDPNDTCAQGPNVPRTDGDLLIEYEIDQGGQQAEIFGRFWNDTTNTWGPQLDLDDSTACDGGPCAVGTINQTTIANVDNDPDTAGLEWDDTDGLGTKQPRTFGEAQIDLDLIFDDDSCTSFGSAMLKSRSSDADRSQLKDFIRPASISLSNCGQVVIRKQTLPVDDPNPTFSYTTLLNREGTTADNPSFNLKDNGSQSYTDVIVGDGYTVTESLPSAPYVFKSLDCSASVGVPQNRADDPNTTDVDETVTGGYSISGRTVTFDIDAGDKLDCTYTNEKPEGALQILKNSTKLENGQPQRVSQAGAQFSYDNDPANPPAAVSVTDDTTSAAPDEDANVGEVCVDGLAAGTYTVNETQAPAGYGSASQTNQTATVVAGTDCDTSAGNNDPGAGATVTFTNPPLADIQVSFRDGGSGETFLTTTGTEPNGISCTGAGTTPDTTQTPTDWDSSVTHEGIAIDPSPKTITCTIEIDP
jgi:hypothetical protein